ncbi:MAG: hypothetical protein ACOCXT_01720 [Candidatus Dojkabacteria bacterium]
MLLLPVTPPPVNQVNTHELILQLPDVVSADTGVIPVPRRAPYEVLALSDVLQLMNQHYLYQLPDDTTGITSTAVNESETKLNQDGSELARADQSTVQIVVEGIQPGCTYFARDDDDSHVLDPLFGTRDTATLEIWNSARSDGFPGGGALTASPHNPSGCAGLNITLPRPGSQDHETMTIDLGTGEITGTLVDEQAARVFERAIDLSAQLGHERLTQVTRPVLMYDFNSVHADHMMRWHETLYNQLGIIPPDTRLIVDTPTTIEELLDSVSNALSTGIREGRDIVMPIGVELPEANAAIASSERIQKLLDKLEETGHLVFVTQSGLQYDSELKKFVPDPRAPINQTALALETLNSTVVQVTSISSFGLASLATGEYDLLLPGPVSHPHPQGHEVDGSISYSGSSAHASWAIMTELYPELSFQEQLRLYKQAFGDPILSVYYPYNDVCSPATQDTEQSQDIATSGSRSNFEVFLPLLLNDRDFTPVYCHSTRVADQTIAAQIAARAIQMDPHAQ